MLSGIPSAASPLVVLFQIVLCMAKHSSRNSENFCFRVNTMRWRVIYVAYRIHDDTFNVLVFIQFYSHMCVFLILTQLFETTVARYIPLQRFLLSTRSEN